MSIPSFGLFQKELTNMQMSEFLFILGNVRYADSNEQHELLIRSQSEELESSSNTPLDNI